MYYGVYKCAPIRSVFFLCNLAVDKGIFDRMATKIEKRNALRCPGRAGTSGKGFCWRTKRQRLSAVLTADPKDQSNQARARGILWCSRESAKR
ncbi:hypothetical protein ANACOL_01011 [Anaerotruncus colihominis DSM 17241]|uniref:Uncharacterized protein n=1 Tax=Anaerotruncus colihominis DSM 17241 TaxID=445972 RepID=B0P8C2_9FIRM|nr:hypothetical protein ANACOL_01011 [Anaerotruncus colihominis DSM 17241]